MVWRMSCAAGVGPLIQLHGRVNANAYLSTSLHFSCKYNDEISKWPGQSPHLSPIENHWKILVNKVAPTLLISHSCNPLKC